MHDEGRIGDRTEDRIEDRIQTSEQLGAMLVAGDVLHDVLGPPQHLLHEVVRGLDGLVRSLGQTLADLVIILLHNGCHSCAT